MVIAMPTKMLGLVLLTTCVNSFIIPEELPSLLSLIYSNIPPIKKGTDSRVGVGFRLGPHADLQVLLELGPQNNTNPIGPDTGMQNKRQIVDMNDLIKNYNTYVNKPLDHVSDTPGGQWIAAWKKALVSGKTYGERSLNSVQQPAPETPEQQTPEQRTKPN